MRPLVPQGPKKGNNLCNSEGAGRRVGASAASAVHDFVVALLKLVEDFVGNVEFVEDDVTVDDELVLFC